MLERRKLWELPGHHRLEIINLALASSCSPLAKKISRALNLINLPMMICEKNTFSQSLQHKLDCLFSASITMLNQAEDRCSLREYWCGRDCACHPEQYLWALCTHPHASEPFIHHACQCARCLGTGTAGGFHREQCVVRACQPSLNQAKSGN